MSHLSKIEEIRTKAFSEIESLGSYPELQEIEVIRVRYLGRKSELTEILRSIPSLPQDERAPVGKMGNLVRKQIEDHLNAIIEKAKKLEQDQKLHQEKIDITVPGKRIEEGGLHPTTLTAQRMIEIFTKMGFDIEYGPEVETDYYNFEALNVPKHHPSRDMQDTFYMSDDTVLRTHTSPVQIRTMEKMKPPVRILSPGFVYRHDQDISHSPMFFQIEGLYVDKNVSCAQLKGVLTEFFKNFFSEETRLRFRPSFFPFTEPSAEVDISCVVCKQKGCRLCKNTGWLEVLGCGMVHRNVFKAVGYDPKKYTGFAFGVGIERLAMLKYGISDMRLLFENDLRFLKQFRTL
ncbi:MAG: phenylalanine--tRNA ligase subunit alpha [Deltaproteobacteria bacterium]|nr:phenylalanine--tRNA ligase subunit alpha [Deltaproteobacteria bacterium]